MDSTRQPRLPFDADPAERAPLATSGARAIEPASAAPLLTSNTDPRGHAISHAPMLLTVRDVEAELQLGRTRTYELIRSGELPVVRLGRVVRVPRDALRRWIEARSSGDDVAATSTSELAP